EWNGASVDYAKDKTLIELFNDQAARTPDAVALISGSTRLTYRELQARALAIAQRLQNFSEIGSPRREEVDECIGGAKTPPHAEGYGETTRQMLVGVCLERSWEMVAAILGTLEAGAAYVAMDPAYPRDRLAFMAKDANLRVVLTQRKLLGSLPEGDAEIILVDDLDA